MVSGDGGEAGGDGGEGGGDGGGWVDLVVIEIMEVVVMEGAGNMEVEVMAEEKVKEAELGLVEMEMELGLVEMDIFH